jgi:hypothetical protein
MPVGRRAIRTLAGGIVGIRPRALHLEDLAAVDETVASEWYEAGAASRTNA